MTIEIITPPVAEPISLEEAKLYLRVDDQTAEDTLIEWLIEMARQHVEATTDRLLMTQTVKYYLDSLSGSIILPRSPVQSITSITYTDADEVEQTLSTDVYEADLKAIKPRVQLQFGQTWPTQYDKINGAAITFVGGVADPASIQEPYLGAMYMMIAYWYENRGMLSQGMTSPPLAGANVDALLTPQRNWSL